MTTQLVSSGGDVLAARLVEQLTDLLQNGGDAEEFIAAHPEQEEMLRRLLPAVRMMADLSRSGEPGASATGVLELGELGDFRLIREVGRGGMGIVYEAEQISLRRRVALKVLPFAATMDPRHLQRFHNEALAAASLHHEHIAPVHGVGCERGVHYYAMQFIDGMTLAEAIDELKQEKGVHHGGTEDTEKKQITAPFLSPCSPCLRGKEFFRRIAKLIADAADALEHAHSTGVVHRDVKPGNLMVDANGKLWVTDFGLARFGADAGLTMTGDLIGTLRYMAPEQALARHGLVDHRADTYGLGATLYELLTGKPAVGGEDKQEILQQIAFEEPVALRKLDRGIPAELETIALKCLAKEPTERYATAGELAADLRRFVEDKPIRARRSTILQMFARRTRRHPLFAVSFGLFVGVMVAGFWAWTREIDHAEAAARVVIAEADQLQRADRLPEAVAVAQRAADLLPRFGGDPELKARVKDRLADLTLRLRLDEARLEQAVGLSGGGGGFDRRSAEPLYREAFLQYGVDMTSADEDAILARLSRSTVREDLVGVLNDWTGLLDESETRKRLERLVEALDTNGPTAQWRQALRATDSKALARLADEAADLAPCQIWWMAKEMRTAHLNKEAEGLARAGVQKHPGDFWLNFLLAAIINDTGKFGSDKPPVDRAAEAASHYRVAAALRPQSPGVWLSLGTALHCANRDDLAEIAIKKAIELRPDYAVAFNNLGNCLRALGRSQEAEEAFRRSIKLGPDNPFPYVNLGGLLNDSRRWPEAVAPLRKAAAAPDFPLARRYLGIALTHVGSSLVHSGELEKALVTLEEAALFSPEYPLTHLCLAEALRLSKRMDEAERSFRRAIEIDPYYSEAHDGLGLVLASLGRLDDAEAAFREAIALNPEYLRAHYDLSLVLGDQGRPQEAKAAFEGAKKVGPEFAITHYQCAGEFRKKLRLAEAEQANRRAIACNPDFAEAYINLGQVLRAQKRFPESLEAYKNGDRLGRKRPSWNYPSETWVRDAEKLLAASQPPKGAP